MEKLGGLARLDGVAQAELVARGELSAAELLEACAERLEALDPLLNAVPVVDGWSLMLLLAPGEHEVRVQAPQTPVGAPVDFTYRLHVEH